MTVLADRYELLRMLGSGGMAQVFAAYDRVLQRQVAIKLTQDARDAVGVERFAREARLAAGLQHPNTVAVFDVGDDGGRPFIVMELVEGRTLADRLREEGRIPLHETVVIADAVLAGLGAAHDRGMVHGDVKPSNILLPDGGEVKLADFGIATVGGSTDLTGAGQVLGTPRYLAPEQAAGQPATPASDIYAVGAIMFECLAGRPVFQGDAATARGRLLAPSLADAVPGIPAGVAAVVDRALADDPAARFANTRAMRHALPDAGAGPPPAPVAAANQAASAPAADATQVMAVPPARRRLWPAVLGLLGVAAALAAVLYLLNRDTPGEAAPSSPQEPIQEPTDEQTSPSDEPDAEAVADIDELVGVLAGDPDRAGKKGGDLLNELRALQSEPDSKEARKLIQKVAEWMAKGELDAGLGAQAVAVLEQESRPEADDLADASALLADVAVAMPEWGDKGKDLHSKLAKLLDTHPPGQQAKQARDLVEQIEKWVAEGKLDPARAEQALSVVRPLTQPG